MNRKQCRGCIYWRGAESKADALTAKCCHHLLDNGKRRVVAEDETCLSRTTKRGKRKAWVDMY